MSDSLTDLQSLIKTQIQAHADLGSFQVFTERDADLSRTVDNAISTYGIAAVVTDFGFTQAGGPNEYETEFSVKVKENRNVNAGGGDALGITCAEVSLQIFLQLYDWEAATMWGKARNLNLETLQLEPEVIRDVSGSFRVVLNNN